MYQMSTIFHKFSQFLASPKISQKPLDFFCGICNNTVIGNEQNPDCDSYQILDWIFGMKPCTYPSHTHGKSNAGKAPKKVSSRHQWIDWICEALVIGGCIGSMVGLVAYANHRDQQYFRTQYITSFPSRPEECQPQDNCKPHYNPQHNS